MKLVLFDIDGTLIRVAGAAGRALTAAIENIYGCPDALAGIQLDGKTDPLIVVEALQSCGACTEPVEETLQPLFERYLALLEVEMERSRNQYRVMPGVSSLLSELAMRSDVLLGLATGNIEAGARMKLEPSGLNEFFEFGGYGSDAADRTEVIRAGIDKAEARIDGSHLERIIVIGDTPRDIIHGRAAGAEVIAVGTGSFTLAQLQTHSPDLLVGSLEPNETVLEFILRN